MKAASNRGSTIKNNLSFPHLVRSNDSKDGIEKDNTNTDEKEGVKKRGQGQLILRHLGKYFTILFQNYFFLFCELVEHVILQRLLRTN